MRSHEIFQRVSQALAAQIFVWLQADQKPVYKAAIQGLANQRKLRPVFVERKPPAERHAWMQAALSRPVSDTLASHVLQAWLLGANKAMLCDFLDGLEIGHSPFAAERENRCHGDGAIREISARGSGGLSACVPRYGQFGAMAAAG